MGALDHSATSNLWLHVCRGAAHEHHQQWDWADASNSDIRGSRSKFHGWIAHHIFVSQAAVASWCAVVGYFLLFFCSINEIAIDSVFFQDLAKFPVDADDLELSFVVVKSMSRNNEISHYQVNSTCERYLVWNFVRLAFWSSSHFYSTVETRPCSFARCPKTPKPRFLRHVCKRKGFQPCWMA